MIAKDETGVKTTKKVIRKTNEQKSGLWKRIWPPWAEEVNTW